MTRMETTMNEKQLFGATRIAQLATVIHGAPFTREDVRNFLRGIAGREGETALQFVMAVSAAALLPWSAAFGGPHGRQAAFLQLAGGVKKAQLEGPSAPVYFEFRPGRKKPLLGSPDEAHPAALRIDVGKITDFALTFLLDVPPSWTK
jgi:hypothetical protein